MDDSVTARFCAALDGIRFEDLNPTVRRNARQLVLDGIAVAFAGAEQSGPTLLREAFGRTQGPCSIIAGGGRTDPLAAARLNGAAMHVLDFEAMWSPANHQTSTTLAAALAAAEMEQADGATVMTAFIKGVEAAGRLRHASRLTEPRTFTFHPPGQVGPIGASVAAGHVFGLELEQLRHAVGIAASSCGALMANAGSMTKALHCGNAASDGLMAALLARRGFTANSDIFGAKFGFVGNVVPELDGEALCATGVPLRIEHPGYAIKLFPSQYGTHFGITAALEAAAMIPDTTQIARVDLLVPDMRYVDRPLPRTGLEGKFSFQYTVAAALLDRKVVIETFTDERLGALDMKRLLPKIHVLPQDDAPAGFENMEVALLVKLSDGKVVETRCGAPRGYLDKGPPVGDDEIEAKARNCLARQLDERQAESLIERLANLATLSHGAMLELYETLRASKLGRTVAGIPASGDAE